MRLHAATRRPALGDDEHLPYRRRTPAAASGDLLGVPDLAVEGRQHRLNVWDDGLDLDHERGRRRLVPGQDVDRAALTADRIGDLRDDIPAALSKKADHLLNECCVICIEEPIGGLTLPIDPDERPRVKRRSDSGERIEPHSPRTAALDPSDHDCETSARLARSIWRQPLCIRSARMTRPTRTTSILEDSPTRVTRHLSRRWLR